MKKKIILIGLIITNLISYSQNENKLRFGVKFSIDENKSSKYLIINQNINGYIIEYNQFNFTSGLIGEYDLNSKLKIETGILYSNKDFTGSYNCATCFIPTVGSPKLIRQRFIEIPIIINYYLIDNNFNVIVHTGLNNDFKIQNELKNNSILLNGLIGLDVGYKVSDDFNFRLGYDYAKSITHFYDDKDFKFITNSFQLKIFYNIR